MRLIERVKINLRSSQMGERTVWPPNHIAALVEYYEAAEAAFSELERHNQLTSVNVQTEFRLQAALAALEAEDG